MKHPQTKFPKLLGQKKVKIYH